MSSSIVFSNDPLFNSILVSPPPPANSLGTGWMIAMMVVVALVLTFENFAIFLFATNLKLTHQYAQIIFDDK